jgi:hypothetical protein
MWQFQNSFFPLLKKWRFSFFLEIFQNDCFTTYVFREGLFNGFLSQKINKIKIKLAALRICVCLSWFEETGGLHSG